MSLGSLLITLSFDIEMPIECDDEYWEHPDPQQCFKQQTERPSVITYFTLYIRLSQILASVLRTVVSSTFSLTVTTSLIQTHSMQSISQRYCWVS